MTQVDQYEPNHFPTSHDLTGCLICYLPSRYRDGFFSYQLPPQSELYSFQENNPTHLYFTQEDAEQMAQQDVYVHYLANSVDLIDLGRMINLLKLERQAPDSVAQILRKTFGTLENPIRKPITSEDLTILGTYLAQLGYSGFIHGPLRSEGNCLYPAFVYLSYQIKMNI